MNWLYIPEGLPYGKERRALIMRMFNNTPDAAYCVNAKYRPQLKHDPDLRLLIRRGLLKRMRFGLTRSSRKTYLVKA